MRPFRTVEGLATPLDRADVDTDQIIPKQFLKRIERTGYGDFLFFDWRFEPEGTPREDFVLNRPELAGAEVLVTGRNFGCGSSREHAVWALQDFGFRVVIASSFADIFRSNALNAGLLPVELPEERVGALLARAAKGDGYRVRVDLERQLVEDGEGFREAFDIDPFRKRCLLEGLDAIGLTLEHEDEILAYERANGIA